MTKENFSIVVRIKDLDGTIKQFENKQKALEYIRTLKFDKELSDSFILKMIQLKKLDLTKWNNYINYFELNDKTNGRQYNLDIVKLMLDNYKDYFIQQPEELTSKKEGVCLPTVLFTCYPFLFNYDKRKFIEITKKLSSKTNLETVLNEYSKEFSVSFKKEVILSNKDYIHNIQKQFDDNNQPILLAFNSIDNTRKSVGHVITLLGYDSTDLYYYDNSDDITEIIIKDSLKQLVMTNKQILIDNGFSNFISFFEKPFDENLLEEFDSYCNNKLFKCYKNNNIHCINKKLFEICTKGLYIITLAKENLIDKNGLSNNFAEKLADVKSKTKLPEGTFTNKAATIKKILVEHSKNKTDCIKKINFYINRAGKNLENKTEVMKAKRMIENMIDFSDLTERLNKINFSLMLSDSDLEYLKSKNIDIQKILADKPKQNSEKLAEKLNNMHPKLCSNGRLTQSDIESFWEMEKRNVFQKNKKVNTALVYEALNWWIENDKLKSERTIELILPEIGQTYDSKTMSIQELKSSGKVTKVIIPGYKVIYKNGEINVHKAVISVS